MSPYPPSLFKDVLMRKPDKPALRKALIKEEEVIGNEKIPTNSSYVIDVPFFTGSDGLKIQYFKILQECMSNT